MKKRNFGEMVAYFNRRVAEMDIAQKYKMELLGMITAIEIKHNELASKWIPVTKALPINDDWVIVSIYDDDGDTSWQYTTPGFYVPYGKCWIVDNEYCKNVIAWMPLPEPAIIRGVK